MVKLFQERYPYHNLSYDATSGQLFFTRKDGVVFSVDELVAMLLEYAHNYAELYAGMLSFGFRDYHQALFIILPLLNFNCGTFCFIIIELYPEK